MKLFRIISSTALAFLVLVSSSSFMVGIHLCGGKVQHVALFTKANSCEMEQNLPPCHRHMQRTCCEDQAVIHKGEGFKASVFHALFVAPIAVDLEEPFVFISEIIPSSSFSRIKYYNYDPPLRSSDLTISLQVFLI